MEVQNDEFSFHNDHFTLSRLEKEYILVSRTRMAKPFFYRYTQM